MCCGRRQSTARLAPPANRVTFDRSEHKFGNNVSNLEAQEGEQALMPKTYTCRDVGVPCDWKVRGETEDEVMRKIRDHARTTHGMNEIPKDLAAKVKAAIRDEK